MLATGALHAANLDPVLEHGLAASSALERLVVLVDGTTTSVTRANERFCQVAGRTLDEVTSSTLGQLLVPGEGARIRTVDEAVAAALGGAPVRVPLQVQGRGGAARRTPRCGASRR